MPKLSLNFIFLLVFLIFSLETFAAVKFSASLEKGSPDWLIRVEVETSDGSYVYTKDIKKGPKGLKVELPISVRPTSEIEFEGEKSTFDVLFGQIVSVIRGSGTAMIKFRSQSEISSLEFKVIYQYCDGKICSLPISQKLVAK